jgi:hypothetical protein
MSILRRLFGRRDGTEDRDASGLELRQTGRKLELFAKVSEDPDVAVHPDTAAMLQDEFFQTFGSGGESRAFAMATRLLLEREYEASIAAFRLFAERYPGRAGDTENQIGAASFFLGRYREAVAHYAASRAHGFDSGMADDNIWEACEAAHRRGDRDAAALYLEHCPNGRYAAKARTLQR